MGSWAAAHVIGLDGKKLRGLTHNQTAHVTPEKEEGSEKKDVPEVPNVLGDTRATGRSDGADQCVAITKDIAE